MSNKKLKFITMTHCEIETIESGTFDGLDLDAIRIDYGNLKSLPSNIFKFQFNLQYLYLEGNQLTKLNAKEFKNLKKLQRLTLFGNIGTVGAKKSDERKAGICDCFDCDLPDFIKDDDERAPSCFLK